MVRIELAERRLIVDGVQVRLRPKVFDVLALLASRPTHLFSKESLIERVWCGRTVTPDVLPGCIREIRRALGDSARCPEWIETVSGTGYRLLRSPDLSVDCSGAARVKKITTEPFSDTNRYRNATVGVLPFEVRTPRTEPVAQALARDIAVGLARTRWLTVAASASTEALPCRANSEKAARTLNVAYLLQGDLQSSNEDLLLQVSLIETQNNRILWADRMRQRGDCAHNLMAEVCGLVTAAVEREIQINEQRQAIIAPVRGVEPWVGLHRGMNFLHRQHPTLLVKADETLRVAARADPACARIAAARSWHAWQELFFGLTHDRETGLSKSRDFALESIDLDPKDPLGHWALGRTHWLSGDMEAASENLECAVSLNPSFAIGHYSLGYTLYLIGREDEAVSCCQTAIRLSPLDPMAFAFHCIIAHIFCFGGKRNAALHHARRISDHPNAHAFALAVSAWVNELCGNRRSAIECVARIRDGWPGYSRSEYMAALLHQSPWYPTDRKRAIEGAFDRLDF